MPRHCRLSIAGPYGSGDSDGGNQPPGLPANSMEKMVKQAVAFVTLTLCLGGAAVSSERQVDPRLKPGNTFRMKFPDFPTDARGIPAAMTVTMPSNYSPDKVFPVFLFMNGGKGSHGHLPALVENRDFICIGMPIFVKDNAKPKGRYIVNRRDVGNLWKYHKPMLERLHAVIPNINRKLGLAAGFSNGANSIRCLVEFTDGVYQTYFNRYIFCEGGTGLYDASKLNGPILGVAGDRAMGIINRPGNVKDTVVTPALRGGVDAEYILMQDTRHEFNTAYYPQVRDWIDRKVLVGGLAANLRTMHQAVVAADWPGALKTYETIVLLTGPEQTERVEADRLLQAVNAAGMEAWAALRAAPLSAKSVTAFVRAWSPCDVVAQAKVAGNPLGETALERLLAGERRQHWEPLSAFIQRWQAFPVATAAQAALAEEGLAAQKAAERVPAGDTRTRAWGDLAQRYPRTLSAAHAMEQLESVWTAENMVLFKTTDREVRAERIKALIPLFAGTPHKTALEKRYRRLTEPKREWRPWKLEQEARRAKKAQERKAAGKADATRDAQE
ncbi:MAG: hypothetical protein HN742_33210 [Lentisphaerae bacterium]|nr:hypothetical protein [Lentisphaerota bacterium]MBT4817054.1 hypothetical protein [Lentisphaerota bacterium]MBT5612938.1 hypothetical protein [Lentisphaerota bacterium]MBT7054026.1 hypothetical protein [Lentisphaerota bacterium]MBT7846777.1 hypothetical protein [Lentisphaerota bacterium]